jgi:hypothetical protein
MTLATSGYGSFVTFGIIIGIGLLAAFLVGCLLAMVLGFSYIYLVLRDKWRGRFWSPQRNAQDVIREITREAKEQLERNKNANHRTRKTDREARR